VIKNWRDVNPGVKLYKHGFRSSLGEMEKRYLFLPDLANINECYNK
jgi:hypothetical protein